MLFQVVLGTLFWIKAYNACDLLNLSSLIAFVLNILFYKENYVLAVKDNGVNE